MLFHWLKKNNNRPIIKIEPTVLDKIIDAVALVFLLLMLAMVFQYYPDLPNKIPTHFGINGQVDSVGSKNTILLLPAFAIVLFVLLQVLGRFPHKFNYMVKITPMNAERQYRLGTRIMRFTNLFVMLVFYYINFKIIKIAIKQQAPLMDKWFGPVVIGISILGTILILTLSLIKNKKNK